MTCTHGHNDRQCELCEKNTEITRLTEAVKTLDEALNQCIFDRDWYSDQLDGAEARCKRLAAEVKAWRTSHADRDSPDFYTFVGNRREISERMDAVDAHNDLDEPKEPTDG